YGFFVGEGFSLPFFPSLAPGGLKTSVTFLKLGYRMLDKSSFFVGEGRQGLVPRILGKASAFHFSPLSPLEV
ncbi:MAG: hypothetical protein Q8O10_05060, partial [candidate division Zixibacteria bacterium]|nr:hypothetical protein [candidate division Zixibacteria bacterium]